MRVIRVLSILIFTSLSLSVPGQDTGLQTKLIDEAYTWSKVTGEQLDSFYFGLQPLQSTKYKSHIRISLTGQLIDFFSSDDTNYFGTLTNYITEYKTVKN